MKSKVPRRRSDIINASEIGQYAYCSRAWWLHRVAGLESANVAEMADGTRRHEEHGHGVRIAFWARWLAYGLLALAAVVALFAILSQVMM